MSEVDRVVFVVDDDEAVRRSLDNLLRSVGLRVQTFGSGQAFLDSMLPDTACCLVSDVRLPGMSGLELQRRVAEAGRPMPVILVTGYGDVPMCAQAMKAGAVEFLTKPVREQDLLDAIQRALERDRQSRDREAALEALRRRFDSLTRREREVMERVVTGMLNKQIAGQLGACETTVKVHRHHIMQKMGCATLAELVRVADMLSVVPPL